MELSKRLEETTRTKFLLPSEWLQRHFYVPEPRDVITGEVLPPGPIRLADHQIRIIDEALSYNPDRTFKYVTIVYSAPKKSGKSAIASGIGLYMADQHAYSNIYCMANDGKGADDRIYSPMKDCFHLHNMYGGKYKGLNYSKTEVIFPNRTKIEPIPCDAKGEAGSQPLVTIWSELWGFDNDTKKQLWTEMTVPPTKWGRAFRWVESYAGFIGISELLENLFNLATKEGQPHPGFTDLKGREGEPVVWINDRAKLFCYWDTVPRMPWQTEGFYQEQALSLPPAEFARVHQNQWISPIGAYIQPEWWYACMDSSLPPLTNSRTPVVVAVDAATENDCAAIVAVTRHPDRPMTDVAVRACRIFKAGGHSDSIILSETIGKTLLEWGKQWNIVCVAYDSYQMKKLAQDYRQGKVELHPDEVKGLSTEEVQEMLKERKRAVQRWYYEFGQHSPRAKADKYLYDMILQKQVHWPSDTPGIDIPFGNKETLTKHITQAGAKNNQGQMRIIKLANELKIDAAVALAMAVDRCMELVIDNKENLPTIKRQFEQGEIDYQEFLDRYTKAVGGS